MTKSLFPLARRLLFALDAENAHTLTLKALAARERLGPVLVPDPPNPWPRLATEVAGVRFRNPLGVAAGLDKNGTAIDGLLRLGFGAVEVGTLTPRPQPGNPRPRIFRLIEDGAIINRLGFNNDGLEAGLAQARGASRRAGTGVLGINVGANKDSTDRIADYVTGVAAAAPLASYLTINISSPNTPGLRDLQHGSALAELLAAVDPARYVRDGSGSDGSGGERRVPLFLKVAPDLDASAVDSIARAAIEGGIDTLVVGNTTVTRDGLRSVHAGEAGGLSGAPLASLARTRLADFRSATGAALPLVAVGGIASGAEAYARIRAGASLVQLYTALVYEGPGLPARMLRELDACLRRDGFASVGEAVGVA